MPHIFISYSRKDLDFAQKIVDALAVNNLDTWIDWKSIPKGEDWEQEIYRGIEEADAFLFLISPDSVASQMCNKEIAHAVKNGKRILPIVIRDAEPKSIHPQISKRNWIFCCEGQDDFNKAIEETRSTIHTDYEWLKYHTELQVKALKWEGKKDTSRLLRGKELREAEQQFAELSRQEDPQPTKIQREYILAGQRNEVRQRRQVTIGLGAGLAIVTILAVFAWNQRNNALNSEATAISESNAKATALVNEENARAIAQAEKDRAEQQARISRAGELAAIAALKRDNEIDLSLLLSVEAINVLDNYRTRANLLSALQAKPNPRRVLREHSLSVTSIAYNPDGKTIASGGLDGKIILWDVISGKPINKPLEIMKNIEPHLTFNPDGSILAFSDCAEIDDTYSFNLTCKTPTIILWDVAKKQEIRRFTGHNKNFIFKLEFSPNGKFIGSGSLGSVLLWDVTSGEVIDEISVHPPFDFAFSPDGKTLVASDCIETSAGLSIWCDNSALVVMDLSSTEHVKHIFEGFPGWFDKLVFSPDGKWLVAGHLDSSSLSFWSIVGQTPKRVNIERQSSAKITDIAFYYHGNTKIMATSQSDGNITLWDIPPVFRPTGRVLSGHVGSVNGLDFSPDGNVLVTAGQDASIILWDLQNESVIRTPLQPEFSEDIYSAAWAMDKKTLITASPTTINFWDIQNRTWKNNLDVQNEPFTLPALKSWTTIVSISPDCETLVIGEGTMLRLWNVFTGEPIGLHFAQESIIGAIAYVKSVAFSPGGKMLAAGYDNGSIILWDPSTHLSLGKPMSVGQSVNSIVFHPNGKILASGDASGFVTLWDVVTLKQISELHIWRGFSVEVTNLAFSPDGMLLASVNGSGTITLIDVNTLQPIAVPLMESSNKALTIMFTPDSSKLVSGTSEGMVMLWDITSGQPIGPLLGHASGVNRVSVSSDGSLAVSADERGAMFLWDINLFSWIDKACNMAGRNISQSEWQQYFPGEPYHLTCHQWPAGE